MQYASDDFTPAELQEMKNTWILQLRTWKTDGTFARLSAASKAGQPVRVKRSDGSVSIGVIHSTAGYGGREVTVEIDTPDGKRFKHIDTEKFLEFNPGFGPALLHLSEVS